MTSKWSAVVGCLLIFTCYVKGDDPKLYWSMSNIEGDLLLPDIGNETLWSADLSSITGSKVVDGYNGYALLLDGIGINCGRTVDIRDTCLFDPSSCDGGGITVTMWLQMQQWTDKFAWIFRNGAHGILPYPGVAIYPETFKDTCRAVVLMPSGTRYYASFKKDLIEPYKWCHVSMTWSEINGTKVYINGTEISSYTAGPATDTGFVQTGDHLLQLGLGSTELQMYMDELKIWYRELSAAEVLDEATASPPVSSAAQTTMVTTESAATATTLSEPPTTTSTAAETITTSTAAPSTTATTTTTPSTSATYPQVKSAGPELVWSMSNIEGDLLLPDIGSDTLWSADLSSITGSKLVNGYNGYALRLDGTGISCGGAVGNRDTCLFDPSSCNGGGISVNMWLQMQKWTDKNGCIFKNGAQGTLPYPGVAIYPEGNTDSCTAAVQMSTGTRHYASFKKELIEPNKWCHMSMTWSEIDGVKVYINGTEVSSYTAGPANETSAVRTRDDLQQLELGSTELHMYMDELKVWYRELSAAEVLDEATVKSAGPELVWSMSNIEGDLLLPDIGSETLWSADLSSITGSKLVNGYNGYALRLDGTGISCGGAVGNRDTCLFDPSSCNGGGISVNMWLQMQKWTDKNGCIFKNGAQGTLPYPGVAIYPEENTDSCTAAVQMSTGTRHYASFKKELIEPNKWCHMSMTWSEIDGVKVYINGTEVSSYTAAPAKEISAVRTRDDLQQLELGSTELHMYMDELKVWYRELSAAEVLDEATVKSAGPELVWSMSNIEGDLLLPDIGSDTLWSADLSSITGSKLVNGYNGYALRLDGTGISCGGAVGNRDLCLFDPSSCNGGGISVNMWLQMQKWTDKNGCIFKNGAQGTLPYPGVAIYPEENTDSCTAAVQMSTGTRHYASFKKELIEPNKWCHMSMTWSEIDGVKVYINGTEVSSYTAGPANETSAVRTRDDLQQLELGSTELHMYMDELKVWYRELSAAEVLDEATAKSAGPELVWSMSNIEGDLLLPDIGSETLWSADLSSITGSKVVDGYNGYALLLDGTSISCGGAVGNRDTCLFNPSSCNGGGISVNMWLQMQKWTDKNGCVFKNGAQGTLPYPGVAIYPEENTDSCTAAVQMSTGTRYYASFKKELIERYKWCHVSMTWSEIVGVKVYINGTEVSSYTAGPANETSAVRTRDDLQQLELGSTELQMYMDELKVWYRELSAAEVLDEATESTAAITTTTVTTESATPTTSTSSVTTTTTFSEAPTTTTTAAEAISTSTAAASTTATTTAAKSSTTASPQGFWTFPVIIGMVVGGTAAIILLVTVIYCCCSKNDPSKPYTPGVEQTNLRPGSSVQCSQGYLD